MLRYRENGNMLYANRNKYVAISEKWEIVGIFSSENYARYN
jgi:hypothetical protein